jgi:hypothetical protein
MNIRSFPSRHTRLRFALASVLVRFAVRVCPLNFANRFAEETEEACQELVESDPFYTSGTWTLDGTQRIS